MIPDPACTEILTQISSDTHLLLMFAAYYVVRRELPVIARMGQRHGQDAAVLGQPTSDPAKPLGADE